MKNAEHHLFEQLKKVFHEMDTLWNTTADQYGFQCNGCDDNCCETEFYHHTHIEKAYFLHGFNRLRRPVIVMSSKKAIKVNTKRHLAAKKGKTLRIMCPVNVEGACILYPYRPMICRLHGIPHEVEIPAGLGQAKKRLHQPGCDPGADLFKKTYHPFDRTPFYSQLATLEKEYCQLKFPGKPQRIKETIAQMIAK